MSAAQLFQYLKDNGIPIEEAAKKTDYAPLYVTYLVRGYTALNDKVRFRFIQAFPETAAFLLQPAPAPGGNGDSSEEA